MSDRSRKALNRALRQARLAAEAGEAKMTDATPFVVVACGIEGHGAWQIVSIEYPTEAAARERLAEIKTYCPEMRLGILTVAEAATRGIE